MQSGANAGLVRGQELKAQLLHKQQVILSIPAGAACVAMLRSSGPDMKASKGPRQQQSGLPEHACKAASSLCKLTRIILQGCLKKDQVSIMRMLPDIHVTTTISACRLTRSALPSWTLRRRVGRPRQCTGTRRRGRGWRAAPRS